MGEQADLYADFVAEFAQLPLIPRPQDGVSFTSEEFNAIFTFTRLLYRAWQTNPSDDALAQSIVQHYSSLLESPSDIEKIAEQIPNVSNAIIELSHIHKNLDLICSESLYDSPDEGFKNSMEEFWDDTAFCISLMSVHTHAVETVSSMYEKIQKTLNDLQTTATCYSLDAADRLLSTVDDFKEEFANIKDIEQKATEYREALEKATKSSADSIVNLNRAENRLYEAQKTAESIFPNVLTILGIFVAILVVFIGGFLITSKATADISYIPQISFAYYILMGQVLSDLFFLLMFLVARLSQNNISTRCPIYIAPDTKGSEQTPEIQHTITSHSECGICQERASCRWRQKLWRKYPYIIMINWFFCISYIVVWIWWFVDAHLYQGWVSFFDSLFGNIIVLILSLLVLVVAFGVPYRIFVRKKN